MRARWLVVAALWVALGCDGPRGGEADAGRDATLVGDSTGKDGTVGAPDGEDVSPPPDPCATVPPVPPFALPHFGIRVDSSELERLNTHTKETDAVELSVAVVAQGRCYRDVTLELHGGTSRTFPKKSYRLTFPEDDPLRTDLFAPLPEEHRRVVLQASWIDPTFMRNALTMQAARASGGLAPRVAFATVSFNGVPYGLFTAIERIDRVWLERQDLDEDGNLYKASSHAANWGANADPMAGFEWKEGQGDDPSDLADLRQRLSKTPATAKDFEAKIAPVLDLADFMVWQRVHTLAMNADTYTKNYYLYHDIEAAPGSKDARFQVISWDADATWGQNWDGKPLAPTSQSWHGSDAFSPRLFSIERYREQYVEDYEEALEHPLSAKALAAWLDDWTPQIAEAAQWDLDLWQPTLSFKTELARLKTAVTTRVDTMRTRVETLPSAE
ncbi:MAG: CotH kinase family protein [Myxococcota bacterium]